MAVDGSRSGWPPAPPGRRGEYLEKCVGPGVATVAMPGLRRRRVVNHPVVIPEAAKLVAAKRTLSPRRVGVYMGHLVPATIELAPAARQDDIEAVLIPPDHMLAIPVENRDRTSPDPLLPPPNQIDHHHAGIEILSGWIESEVTVVGYRPVGDEMVATSPLGWQAAGRVEAGAAQVSDRQGHPIRQRGPATTEPSARGFIEWHASLQAWFCGRRVGSPAASPRLVRRCPIRWRPVRTSGRSPAGPGALERSR